MFRKQTLQNILGSELIFSFDYFCDHFHPKDSESIKNYLFNKDNISLELIDEYNFNGDYIESQAFGYLAIRTYLNLPISYPKTTSCSAPTVGGKIIKNF